MGYAPMSDHDDDSNDPPMSPFILDERTLEALLIRSKPEPDLERLAEIRRRLFGERPADAPTSTEETE